MASEWVVRELGQVCRSRVAVGNIQVTKSWAHSYHSVGGGGGVIRVTPTEHRSILTLIVT